ncbi:Trehalose synthase [ANME-1 cluster archaeon GoMg3.2]|nr:Trehalose synthase [ANME-1 cluster archaeon GoMg3.2]
MIIGHVINGFPPAVIGGREMFVYHLADNLSKNNIDVEYHVITSHHKNLVLNEKINDFYVHRYFNLTPDSWKLYSIGEGYNSFKKYFAVGVDLVFASFSLYKFIKKYNLNLLHASSIYPSGASIVTVKKISKIPTIITVHGNADFYQVSRSIRNVFLGPVLSSCAKIIAVGYELADNIQNGLNYDLDIEVIPNGINIDQFSSYDHNIAENIIKRYDLENKKIVFVISRLVERKNIHRLVKSFPKVIESLGEARLVIAGVGPAKERLEKLVRELRISNYVIFTGSISEEEKIAFYHISDIFVQLTLSEGLSIAMIESKAAGLPAIAARFPGTSEPVTDGKSGYIVDVPVDRDELSEKILHLLTDDALRRQMGEYSFEEAKNKYSLDKMIEKYYEVYSKLI